MRTFYVTTSAWINDQICCESLVKRFVKRKDGQADSIVLDSAAIEREQMTRFDEEGVFHFVEVDFREWINETLTEEGVINIEIIRRSVSKISENQIFVVNAIGFNSAVIYRALAQLRIAFFNLVNWPQALVFIGDDAQLHQVSPALAMAFYIRPSILGRAAISDITHQIKISAIYLRIFGRMGQGTRLGKILNFTFKKIIRLMDWQYRREVKERGWIYEE